MSAALSNQWSAQARFAIYFAPARASGWWEAGSAWLGRDAESGDALALPADAGTPSLSNSLERLTASPRRYGWHGTLVAPFCLADNVTVADLLDRAERWAHTQTAFGLPVEADTLGDFVAMRPAASSGDERMRQLAADALRTFAPLRIQPSAADIAKRMEAPLTERQRELLVEWGYPYVLDEFRFHMTLSNSLDNADDRAAMVAWWQRESTKLGPLPVDGAAIFVEAAPGEPFMLWQRLAFTAKEERENA
jgi:putative phosphonate metabolism protein